jgi:hypothetical protein
MTRTALFLILVTGCSGAIGEPSTSPRAPAGASPAGDEPPPAAAAVAPDPGAVPQGGLRRLTASQYRNTVEALFGAPLVVPALEPEPAAAGFTSVGASTVATSPVGVERYEAAAASIARQVMASGARRAALVGCAPTGPEDDACARAFLARLGRLMYRRPLAAAELERVARLALDAARDTRDFFRGMEVAVAALLQSPKFLYRPELGAPLSGARDGRRRLSGHELGARLAFFLWNAGPDAELLDAAGRGELDAPEGLRRQAARLYASPRARRGFRTFFQELMRLEDPAGHEPGTLPLPSALVNAIHEQALLTSEDALFARGADFGELVRSPITFLNRDMAAHYGVAGPVGTRLERVSWPPESPRLGLLAQAAILIETSNQPHSSPTARGAFVREALLCQPVPPPPPNANTELAPAPPDTPVTMRQRLDAHRSDPACAGCHALTDPVGLGLESFDSLGRFRDRENGLPIDPSGALDGRPFRDARELAEAVSRHPDLPGCFVRQLVRHATGREEPERSVSLERLAREAGAGVRRLEELVMALVSSDLFQEVMP